MSKAPDEATRRRHCLKLAGLAGASFLAITRLAARTLLKRSVDADRARWAVSAIAGRLQPETREHG